MRILTEIVDQYRTLHNALPIKIVVTPLAAVSLGLKDSLGPLWCGVPVEMRPFDEAEVVEPGTGRQLAVFLKKQEYDQEVSYVLAGCELS
jgi:hypothetical protein